MGSKKKEKKGVGQRTDDGSLTSIKNAFRGRRVQDAPYVLNHLRQKLDVREYPKLAAWLVNNSLLSRQVFHPPFPQTLMLLKGQMTLEPVSLEREVHWAAAYLALYGKSLTAFVNLSRQFQRTILRSEYQAATDILRTIEKTHGQSLWLIKNRIALLQLAHGLNAQKEYVKHVIANSIPQGIAGGVAYYASNRNEETVTLNHFTRRIRAQINEQTIGHDAACYLQHHLIGDIPRPIEDVVHVLRHEQAGTVVDGYETLTGVARLAISMDCNALLPAFRHALDTLAKTIEDPRLGISLVELGGQQAALPIADTNAAAARAHFLRGSYELSAQVARSALESTSDNPELLLIAAQSGTVLFSEAKAEAPSAKREEHTTSNAPLWSRITEDLIDIISRNKDEMEESSNRLLKLGLNFDGHSWAEIVGGFVVQERSPNPLARMDAFPHFAMLGAGMSTPMLVGSSPKPVARRAFANVLQKQHGDNILTSYAMALAADADTSNPVNFGDIALEQRALLLAEHYVAIGRFSEALTATREMGEQVSVNGIFNRYRVRLECHCLLRLARVDECVDLIGAAFAQDYSLTDVLPLRDVVAAIDEGVRKRMRARPTLGIAYAMYNATIDTTQERYLAFAYEDFLMANNVNRPSELASRLNEFDHNQIVFFLYAVCVEPVMAKSVEFKSSREIIEERIAVCRLLLEIEPSSAEQFQAEIRDLLGNLMVRRRLRDVEQRKIYVDLAGVARTAETRLRENFNRYIAFLKHGTRMSLPAGFHDVLREQLRLGGDIQGLTRLLLPKDEVGDLFRSMLLDLRDEYVSSSAHGLDGYLSVRIRHGTLSGHLRSPIEAQHLITPRDEATGEYRPNEYWAERFSGGSPEARQQVAIHLAAFARAFDELVQRMLSDWIRVRRTFEEKGLFDFRLYETQSIAEIISAETSFTEFLQIVFTLFGQHLEKNLAVVRDTIEREAKSKVNDLLTNLQTQIASLHNEFDARAFNSFSNAISSARTGAQVAFDRVIEWFHVSAATAQDPFSIEDAVRVSAESVRTATRKVIANVHVIAPEKQRLLNGTLLPIFVDLFFIVFENITKHSATPSPHHADVQITYSDDKIHCRIESKVANSVASDAAQARVEEIRVAMREPSNLAAVSREGGTGLLKIRKILTHDLQLPPELNFGFRGDHSFFVEFTIPVQMLAHESHK